MAENGDCKVDMGLFADGWKVLVAVAGILLAWNDSFVAAVGMDLFSVFSFVSVYGILCWCIAATEVGHDKWKCVPEWATELRDSMASLACRVDEIEKSRFNNPAKETKEDLERGEVPKRRGHAGDHVPFGATREKVLPGSTFFAGQPDSYEVVICNLDTSGDYVPIGGGVRWGDFLWTALHNVDEVDFKITVRRNGEFVETDEEYSLAALVAEDRVIYVGPTVLIDFSDAKFWSKLGITSCTILGDSSNGFPRIGGYTDFTNGKYELSVGPVETGSLGTLYYKGSTVPGFSGQPLKIGTKGVIGLHVYGQVLQNTSVSSAFMYSIYKLFVEGDVVYPTRKSALKGFERLEEDSPETKASNKGKVKGRAKAQKVGGRRGGKTVGAKKGRKHESAYEWYDDMEEDDEYEYQHHGYDHYLLFDRKRGKSWLVTEDTIQDLEERARMVGAHVKEISHPRGDRDDYERLRDEPVSSSSSESESETVDTVDDAATLNLKASDSGLNPVGQNLTQTTRPDSVTETESNMIVELRRQLAEITTRLNRQTEILDGVTAAGVKASTEPTKKKKKKEKGKGGKTNLASVDLTAAGKVISTLQQEQPVISLK